MGILNLTNRLITFLYNFSKRDFETEVRTQAKRCLLDYLGVTFAGSFALGEKLDLLIKQFDRGLHEAPVIGASKRVSFENAAYINGISSHLLELDDGVRFGGIHAGAPIFSALLALAETESISGEQLIRGIITGYEAAIRLASAMQPHHHDRGYHPTGTCGAIGATIALSVALNFTLEEMKTAFSSAAVNSAGTLKVLEGASELKPLNVSNAALNAIMAIHNARVGFMTPDDVLLGNSGLISMMAGDYSKSILLNPNKEPAIMNVYFKIFAACRHCHSPIEALLNIVRGFKILPEDIKSIKVKTYSYVMGKHDHKTVVSPASAKMSIPYSIAVALLYGSAHDEHFSYKTIQSPLVKEIIEKIEIIEDLELSKLVPNRRPSIVEVLLHNGDLYKEQVDFPKGEPENPLSNQELSEKFKMLMEIAGKSENTVEDIISIVFNLESSFVELYRSLLV
jgi:2-methylcitrate dehydratase PrpD